MENNFLIGKIVNTQGVHGEMRVIPTTDDITRFELLDSVFIDEKEYEIERVRYHKQFVLLKLKGIDDMTAAERYKTKEVRIPEDWALPCEEDEYYIKDLYGMKVVDEDNNEIGKIKDVIFTGANDVYIVKPKTGKDILIPAIKDCVLKVDVAEKTMHIHLMEGLLE